MPFCPDCGARVDESDNFCTECGGQLYKLRHTARGSTPTRVRRIFLLLVLLFCCCVLLFVVGRERGYFEFGQNSDGKTTPSEVSQTPTSTPPSVAECETDEVALQIAVWAFYDESGGDWPTIDFNVPGDVSWAASDGLGSTFVPDYLVEILKSDSICDWHIDSSGLVYAAEVGCPCDTELESSPAPGCKYVWTEVHGTRYPEPGADYEPIVLCDNPEATDVTWPELKDFLREDKTDEMLYIEDVFMCADFAEMLHNNAEAAGIRAAWVGIDLYGSDEGHALNAFNTTDRGLVYIDVTNADVAPCSSDSIATVLEGKQLASELIFPPCAGQDLEPMGKVKEIWIT